MTSDAAYQAGHALAERLKSGAEAILRNRYARWLPAGVAKANALSAAIKVFEKEVSA